MLNAKYANVEKTKKSSGSELKAECSDGQKKECVSAEGYKGYMKCENKSYSEKCLIANLDECSINKNQLYNVCCKDKSGTIYDCNEKKDFKPGEYIIIKTNLQKALQHSNLNLDAYRACAFSKLLSADSEVPRHYEPDTAFSSSEVGCSRTFNSNKFHQASVDGFVPEGDGKVVLSEIRIYPADAVLANGQDALNKMDISTSVFKFEVDIGG